MWLVLSCQRIFKRMINDEFKYSYKKCVKHAELQGKSTYNYVVGYTYYVFSMNFYSRTH